MQTALELAAELQTDVQRGDARIDEGASRPFQRHINSNLLGPSPPREIESLTRELVSESMK